MSETCLHCGQSRAQVRAGGTICGIEGGYEYRELEAEWPRHRWKPWSDRELRRFGIGEWAYEEYRRCLVEDFQWVACVHTDRGHVWASEGSEEYGIKQGQCWDCGKMRE